MTSGLYVKILTVPSRAQVATSRPCGNAKWWFRQWGEGPTERYRPRQYIRASFFLLSLLDCWKEFNQLWWRIQHSTPSFSSFPLSISIFRILRLNFSVHLVHSLRRTILLACSQIMWLIASSLWGVSSSTGRCVYSDKTCSRREKEDIYTINIYISCSYNYINYYWRDVEEWLTGFIVSDYFDKTHNAYIHIHIIYICKCSPEELAR